MGKVILLSIAAVLGISILSLVGWVQGTYNTLVSRDQQVQTAWAAVETQYQRRMDLIPNLANSVKGFLGQERGIIESIAEARTHYANAPVGSSEQVGAANQMEGALARLMVVIENYPTLKSDATVASLMDELAGTENRVNIARDRYNGEVQTYNTYIKQFPTLIIANFANYKEKPFFKSDAQAKNAPTVNLDLGDSQNAKPATATQSAR